MTLARAQGDGMLLEFASAVDADTQIYSDIAELLSESLRNRPKFRRTFAQRSAPFPERQSLSKLRGVAQTALAVA